MIDLPKIQELDFCILDKNGEIVTIFYSTSKPEKDWMVLRKDDLSLLKQVNGNWSHKRVDGKWIEIDNTSFEIEDLILEKTKQITQKTEQDIVDGFIMNDYHYRFDEKNQMNWKDITDHPDKYLSRWPVPIWCAGQPIKMHTAEELAAVMDKFRDFKYDLLERGKQKQLEVSMLDNPDDILSFEV